MNLREAAAQGFHVLLPEDTRVRTMIGWTNPDVIYDSMRRINGDAAALDSLVRTNVADNAFRAAWSAWYEGQWRPFFAKYQTPGLAGDTGRWGALFSTDAIAREVETQSQIYRGFVEDYNRQRTVAGAPVPQVRTPPLEQPLVKADADEKRSGWSLPWWAWALGGAAVVGTGVFLWVKYQEAQRAKRTIYRSVLPRVVGPEIAREAEEANRDYERSAYASRDPNVPHAMTPSRTAGMRTLADYAQDPRAAMTLPPVVYRPYEHPHLVPAPAPYAPAPYPMRSRSSPPPSRAWGSSGYDDDGGEGDYDDGDDGE